MTDVNLGGRRFSIQQVIGLVILVLIVIFFLENWDALFGKDLTLRFIIPEVTMSPFWWLVILTAAGTLGGFMLGRARYKRKSG